MKGTLAIALAGMLALPLAAGAELYKWKDKNGKVHFGNVPPPSGSTDVESRGQERAAPPAEESGAATPEAGGSAAGSDAAPPVDDGFSSRASNQRRTLKRDLAAAKREAESATEELEDARRTQARPTPATERDQVLTQVDRIESALKGERGPNVAALEQRKKAADAKVEEIRAQWSGLEDEARKRYDGRLPEWWSPLER